MRRSLFYLLILSGCSDSDRATERGRSGQSGTSFERPLAASAEEALCLDPITQRTIVHSMLQDSPQLVEEYGKLLRSGGAIKFDAISVRSVEESVNEVSCAGNMVAAGQHYAVNYSVRPAAGAEGHVVESLFPTASSGEVARALLNEINDQLRAKGLLAPPPAPEPDPTENLTALPLDDREDQ